MPIHNVDQSRSVIVLKRSMSSGYAGIENPLFFGQGTSMFFGDAKKSVSEVIEELEALYRCCVESSDAAAERRQRVSQTQPYGSRVRHKDEKYTFAAGGRLFWGVLCLLTDEASFVTGPNT